jgi:hypothetical protein
MSKIIRLTETELVRLVNRIVKENNEDIDFEGFDTPLEDEPPLFNDVYSGYCCCGACFG